MGEMADIYYEMAFEQYVDVQNSIHIILNEKSNLELIEEVKKSKDDLVNGIKDYFNKKNILSEKQRYCLAKWIIENN